MAPMSTCAELHSHSPYLTLSGKEGLSMSRVRRIIFVVVMVALVGASSTGLSRSACGRGVDSVNGGLNYFNEGMDWATGDCGNSNGRCLGFS
jgi:hypothetical protein